MQVDSTQEDASMPSTIVPTPVVADSSVSPEKGSSEAPAAETSSPLQQKQSFWYYVPLFNLLYEVILDPTPPPLSDLKEAMGTLGLLSALLLTVAMAVPGAVEFDELKAVTERMEEPPYSTIGFTYQEVNYLMISTGLTVYLLGSCVVAVVFTLVIIPMCSDYMRTDEHYTIWWSWSRWVVLWTIGNCIAGSVAGFFSFNFLMRVKFPDYFAEYGGDHFSVRSWTRDMAIFYIALPAILVGFFFSGAQVAVLRAAKKTQVHAVGSASERAE